MNALEKSIIVLGSGGHAKVLIEILRENKIPIRVFSILEKDCFKGVYNNKLNYSEINDV